MVIQSAAEIEHGVDTKNKNKILGHCPDPKSLLVAAKKPVDTRVLEELENTSILSAHMFHLDLVTELFKLAALLQIRATDASQALSDKILAAAFFEPSTRTRLSFESAMLQLGGKTLSVTEAATTGIAKGESLRDIGQMFNSYAHVVVVRHTEQKALMELSKYLRIPMINGGNGSDEHPTQALADWYALVKWKPELALSQLPESEKIHLGIIGSPGNMRSVKSFLRLALLFGKNIKKISIISEMIDPLGKDVSEFVNDSPIEVELLGDLNKIVNKLDVIYMNSIALLGDSYKKLGSRYHLTRQSNLKDSAVILHPLARNEELSVDLDSTAHNLYFNQADGAVFIRQALLLSLFGRFPETTNINITH
ncbi:MAG: hypothetical protein KDD61_12540 [Bdellovibrionales bacterium]|nr:hypothetical protein [Bdellovibrionales bacterium]